MIYEGNKKIDTNALLDLIKKICPKTGKKNRAYPPTVLDQPESSPKPAAKVLYNPAEEDLNEAFDPEDDEIPMADDLFDVTSIIIYLSYRST